MWIVLTHLHLCITLCKLYLTAIIWLKLYRNPLGFVILERQVWLTWHFYLIQVYCSHAESFHHFQTLTTVDCVLMLDFPSRVLPRKCWNYSQADFHRACELIDAINWDVLLQLSSGNIDDLWHLWYEKFMSIIEECIPQSSVHTNRNLP